jgi:hypothetical protein
MAVIIAMSRGNVQVAVCPRFLTAEDAENAERNAKFATTHRFPNHVFSALSAFSAVRNAP